MARVLIIEDEPDLQQVLEYNLRSAGHEVLASLGGKEGLRQAQDARPDVVLLDLMLPDMPGTDVCRSLKSDTRTRDVPVIMLTAKGAEIDRVVGFELGADDYVVKPFSVREVLLRISAVTRRGAQTAKETDARTFEFGVLRVDRDAHRAWVSGEELELTALEFKLLTMLHDRKNRVQTRATLLDDVWGITAEVTTRTVDTHVKRLREKLGAAGDYIETVRGVGYRFAEEPLAAPLSLSTGLPACAIHARTMARVLLIEDEADLLEIVSYNVRQAGHEVVTAANGKDGLKAAREAVPDLVLLDLMLPDIAGQDVCRALKADPRTKHVPVIMLTARGDEIDRVVGFELGAEDYVVKPFSVRELLLRVNAVLRRTQKGAREVEPSPSFEFGALRVDRGAHRVWVNGEEVELTALELKLLTVLYDRRNRVQTRGVLLDDVWGIKSDVTTRTVDTHVKRLREKLGAAGEYVETVRGVGYRFAERPGE